MAFYTALIRKESGTDYWIDAPDIPGCVSSGKARFTRVCACKAR